MKSLTALYFPEVTIRTYLATDGEKAIVYTIEEFDEEDEIVGGDRLFHYETEMENFHLAAKCFSTITALCIAPSHKEFIKLLHEADLPGDCLLIPL